jgi:hypothetical protein
MNELLSFRQRFASLENCCHLSSNSLGAMVDDERDAVMTEIDQIVVA